MAVSGQAVQFVKISATDYAALETKDENTIYFVTDPTGSNSIQVGNDRFGSSLEYPDGDNVKYGQSE